MEHIGERVPVVVSFTGKIMDLSHLNLNGLRESFRSKR